MSDLKKRKIPDFVIVILCVVTFGSLLTFVLFGGRTRLFMKNDGEMWALIKVNGGEPLHVRVVDYMRYGEGTVRIVTEDRIYETSMDNVLLIQDREGDK